MPGKTQEVFVRKKYVSTYNVSIFPQVVTPLYDTFLGARPPCSKKVASKLVHRWGLHAILQDKSATCVIIISLRARITYYSSAHVHTHTEVPT